MGKMNIGNSWISKYNYGCCDTNIPLFSEHRYGMGKSTNIDAFIGTNVQILTHLAELR
jgi:hypothetical protein